MLEGSSAQARRKKLRYGLPVVGGGAAWCTYKGIKYELEWFQNRICNGGKEAEAVEGRWAREWHRQGGSGLVEVADGLGKGMRDAEAGGGTGKQEGFEAAVTCYLGGRGSRDVGGSSARQAGRS